HTRSDRDWSSDVCSSDLGRGVPFGEVDARVVDIQVIPAAVLERVQVLELDHQGRPVWDALVGEQAPPGPPDEALDGEAGVLGQQIGRASCRESVEVAWGG